MKKLFLFGILFLTACQSATPEPSARPEDKVTRTSPPPVSVTAPLTITPVPTPSPTPVPPERYFTEEFDAPPVHWSTLYANGDGKGVNVRNRGSRLIFEFASPNAWVYAIYGAFAYESAHLETRAASLGSGINAMGLVCHYDEQAGWYEFNISNVGTYNVLYGQWLAEGIARYTPILNDTSERIERGNSMNEIGLDCYENIVQLYINGKLIRKMDVTHIGLEGGKVGLSLASFEETPVILSFDRVTVSNIESP